MSEELVPPDRLRFYNTFGQHVISSAVDAIDDCVQASTGRRCGRDLRQEIADIMAAAWDRYSESLEADFKAGAPPREGLAAVLNCSLEAAARVSNAVSDSVGQDLIEVLGVAITQEVQRALTSLAEALCNIYRDTILDLGYSPSDPRFKPPQVE